MGTFEKDESINLRDLMPLGIQPSRAIGASMPDSPENTWLQGYIPPPPTPEAPVPAVAPPAFMNPSGPDPVNQAVVGQGAPNLEAVPDVLFFENGLTNFGGETFLMDEEGLAAIINITLEAYERFLANRARELRGRYMQQKAGREVPLQSAGGTGPEVVREVHRPQEEANEPPQAVPLLRPPGPPRRKGVRKLSGQETRVPASPSNP